MIFDFVLQYTQNGLVYYGMFHGYIYQHFELLFIKIRIKRKKMPPKAFTFGGISIADKVPLNSGTKYTNVKEGRASLYKKTKGCEKTIFL